MQNLPKIVRERLRTATPAVNHPDADELTAFAERSLPEFERDFVLEHLARCGDCRDIVALALPAMEPVETAASRSPSPSPGAWLTWPALRWGFVAAGIAAIASFGILQYQRRARPTTMALKQSTHTEMAANEGKKAVAPFVAVPSEKRDKLQSAAAPAFADSVSRSAASGDKKRVARADAPSAPVMPPQLGSSGGHSAGAAVRGPLPHGPRLANAWQQQNATQNQAPVPAPPWAYSKQQNAAADLSANERAPAASETVEASGNASAITMQAQNLDMSPVRNQPAGQLDRTYRAKPPVPPTSAQGSPGQVGGYVVDPSGAVVPNARITITPSNTGGTATAVTNSQGAWLIAGLPTGNYKAQAEAPGFKTTVLDFNYDANRPSMYSFTLSLGSGSETVEVSAQNAQVQTEGANISAITNRQVRETPVNGRNATPLSALSSGLLPRWTISAAGGLQRSFDQGNTWQTVDVTANPDSFSFVGGTSLVVAKTSRAKAAREEANQKDADKIRKQDSSTLTFRAVAATGSDVWAGGSAGALYHSLDAGNHWTRIAPASSGSTLTGDIISLEFSDPQHGRLSTSTSEIWTTGDDGLTWQKQ
jgi:hypothetical protein